MKRISEEKHYWENASKDPELKDKYICDLSDDFWKVLGDLEKPALDIGCGIGRLTREGDFGIDISEGMIKLAIERNPDCSFYVSDGRTIPFPAESFKSAYSVLLFQHLPLDAVQGYIDEAYRVLRKDGIFKFQFIEGDNDFPFSKHHKLHDIKLGGFKVIEGRKGLIHPQWSWVTLKK